MHGGTTRRGFLGLGGRAAAVTAVAAALPVICTAQAHAEELPIVLHPEDPHAIHPRVSDSDYAAGVSREPLNGSVSCATGGTR
ncbi:hypothetical protein JJV70_10875 [Streptomyces sp. JJ66]|uniref:hypothetical protein n=1 Tax=Streptomyces sp. JJ66 TaxID=2803843 RepID=UPI001C57B174|nr:hypothetical protein [Streptomyces sp. JJ66]MBW1602599.1 hypothetical protein [Streptomyces sp. JJ66]